MPKSRTDEVLTACGSIVGELAAGALGDQRLDARRDRVVAILEQQPDRGFPDACADDAESEALYRFLRNPRVLPEAVFAPHCDATAVRCAALGEVLVLHDTTDMVFTGTAPRRGLTQLSANRHGFWVHASLAVSADGTRAPVGVLALHSYARDPDRPPRTSHYARFKEPTKESRRWLDGVRHTRTRLGSTLAIHVMDREGDSYEILATLVAQAERFVIRLAYDRRIAPIGAATHVGEALVQATVVCQREVSLSARRALPPGRNLYARQRHPARTARVATLQIATQRVEVRRSANLAVATAPAGLPVHVVWVREVDAPAGVDPIEWRLVTTEPIDTEAQVLRIVDAYRARWLIEEYFKALKTGCAYEQRQLESLQTLRVALALLAPIAWRLLLLRYLARMAPDAPATLVLTPRQFRVLCASKPGAKLPSPATVTELLAAVARLGGHLRQNGPPGWLVLARGLQKLQDMELGWIAALEAGAEL